MTGARAGAKERWGGQDEVGKSRSERPYSYSDLGLHQWDAALSADAGSCLGLDFGGTLSKIVFFEPSQALPAHARINTLQGFMLGSTEYGTSGVRDEELSFASERLGGRLHFIRFETAHTMGAIRMLENVQHNISRVHATGGGSYKYSKLVKDKLGIRMLKQDELQTVVRGIIFTLLEHPDSACFTYKTEPKDRLSNNLHAHIAHGDALTPSDKVTIPMKLPDAFPFLVVNIGSGVSIINVTSPSSFKRVSGTAVGGATYYGLCKLLLRCRTFDEAMDLAELGDSRNVNLTVQDIYGGSYESAGLSGEVTASFFGRCAQTQGTVRTSRLRKRPYVSVLEKLGLVLIALLCANLLAGLRALPAVLLDAGAADSSTAGAGAEVAGLAAALREVVLLLLPGSIAYLVFWSSEAALSSSHPPDLPPPLPSQPHPASRLAAAAAEAATAKAAKALKAARGEQPQTAFEEADIARALVVMVAQNVTQIAFLNAKIHQSKRVLFTGNFLRHNNIALRALSSMMGNWSQGEVQALFMEHEGYFGAIGSFLHSLGADLDKLEGSTPPHSGTAPPSAGRDRDRDRDTDGDRSPLDRSNSEEGNNVIEDLLFKGEFPRRRPSIK
jgi:type II pantothenate kinase